MTDCAPYSLMTDWVLAPSKPDCTEYFLYSKFRYSSGWSLCSADDGSIMHKFKLPVVSVAPNPILSWRVRFVEGDVDEHKMPSHKTWRDRVSSYQQREEGFAADAIIVRWLGDRDLPVGTEMVSAQSQCHQLQVVVGPVMVSLLWVSSPSGRHWRHTGQIQLSCWWSTQHLHTQNKPGMLAGLWCWSSSWSLFRLIFSLIIFKWDKGSQTFISVWFWYFPRVEHTDFNPQGKSNFLCLKTIL